MADTLTNVDADWLAKERAAIEQRLSVALPPESAPPAGLHRAMRYAALGEGKRVRPLLCRAAAWAVAGKDCEAAWAPALAVECIHAYSLIHDDLPALDNDDMRRGRPSCHKAFGEATAILAGDGLQTLAFALAAQAGSAAVAILAGAAGTPGGMVGGQALELESPEGDRETIRRAKTGALIEASLVLGGLAAGAQDAQLRDLKRYGAAVGLSFQIVDDVLDHQGEATAPARLAALTAEAQLALSEWGVAAGRLRHLANALAHRNA